MTRERVDISIPGKPGSLKNIVLPANTPGFGGVYHKGARNAESGLTCGNTKQKNSAVLTHPCMILTHLRNTRSDGCACQNDTPLHDFDTPAKTGMCQNDTSPGKIRCFEFRVALSRCRSPFRQVGSPWGFQGAFSFVLGVTITVLII